MSIPNPSLDDIQFQDLVEEARRKIPELTPSWTNYNLSDPGITLIDLLAWLVDIQIYRVNRIPRTSYLKFLKLVGIRPKEHILPHTELTIFVESVSNTVSLNRSVMIPKGSHFTLKSEGISFETDEEFWFIPSLIISKAVSYSRFEYLERSLKHSQARCDYEDFQSSMPTSYFYLFGVEPIQGDSFYLELKFNIQHINKNDPITLWFYLYEKDLPPVGRHGQEEPEEFIERGYESKVVWEFLDLRSSVRTSRYDNNDENGDNANDDEEARGEGQQRIDNSRGNNNDDNISDDGDRVIDHSNMHWTPLELSADTTTSFSRSGRITFKFPLNHGVDEKSYFDIFKDIPVVNQQTENRSDRKDNKNQDAFILIRCRLIENKYETPPRIESILCNTVGCTYGQTVTETLINSSPISYNNADGSAQNDMERSTGLANQIFEIGDKFKLPILRLEYLKVDNEMWQQVYDLDSSRPFDSHFVLHDKSNGIFTFGDGENGKVPKKGSRISVWYRYGNLRGFNFIIKDKKCFELSPRSTKSDSRDDLSCKNIVAINNFPSTVGRGEETIKDAVIIARQEQTVPFRLVSLNDCEYIARNTPGLRVGKVKATLESENMLVLSVIPYSFASRPEANEHFLNAIRRHLNKHRLITTRLKVISPQYVGIDITIKLLLVQSKRNIYEAELTKHRISNLLDHYFRPISHCHGNSDLGPPNNYSDMGWDFGRNVYRSEIIAIIKSVPGVKDVAELFLSGVGKNTSYERDEEGNVVIKELDLVYLRNLSVSVI
jgi:predicted phage baseplate assembly protein